MLPPHRRGPRRRRWRSWRSPTAPTPPPPPPRTSCARPRAASARASGAKQMSQVGASDAGSAAARVVGVSIESSQLVIRGLGGRYTRVLLNGIPVPSIDPDVPGADLDLFPTGVIDSLTISKTFLPDMPGRLRRRGDGDQERQLPPPVHPGARGSRPGLDSPVDLPRAPGLQRRQLRRASASTTAGARCPPPIPGDSRCAAQPGLPDRRSRYAGRPRRCATAGSTARKRRAAQDGRRRHRRRLAQVRRAEALRLPGHRRLRIRQRPQGGHEPAQPRSCRRPTACSTQRNDYRVETGVDEVQLSALGTASLDLGIDHSLTVLSLFNRSVSDETVAADGASADYGGAYLEKWQLQYLARTLWFNQALRRSPQPVRHPAAAALGAAFTPTASATSPTGARWPTATTASVLEWLVRSGSGERFYSNLRQDDLGEQPQPAVSRCGPQAWGTVGGFSPAARCATSATAASAWSRTSSNTDATVFQRRRSRSC